MARAYNFQSLLLIVLVTALSNGIIRADSLLLPGHAKNLNETTKHCYGALVATFEKVGMVDMGPVGAADYESHWKVTRVLRGDFSSETDLSIRVQSLPKEQSESLPIVDKSYILIGYSPEVAHHQIAIILEDTPENLKKMQKLLQP